MAEGHQSDLRNVLEGDVHTAVQAGRIDGGIHLHYGARPVPAPRMVPSKTVHFTNQLRVLREADEAWEAADRSRPVVLGFVGLPGVGKTEVARAWLEAHADEFPDGHFDADLAAGGTQDGLESTFLREFLIAVGYQPGAIPDTAEGRAAAFRSWSAGKRVAVMVDKALTPSQVRMLTPGAGRSVVLLTVPARLAGLGAREQAAVIDLSPMAESAARELLGRIGGADRVAAEPDAVRALVGFCGGLPIALSVAAATVAAYPRRRISRLVDDLRDRRRGLPALSRLPDLSVEAVFDAAHARLGELARDCYQVLGAHPGAGDVAVGTIAAVLDLDVVDVRDAVDEIIDAGLVQEPAEDRLSLHTLTHLHAWSKADRGTRHDELLARILGHYHRVGVAAGHAAMPRRPWRDHLASHLAPFDVLAPADPMAWLSAERVNLATTVARAAESGTPHYAWELALMLWPLHERGKYLDDMAATAAAGAEAARAAGLPLVEAVLLTQHGFAALHRGEPKAARALFDRAIAGSGGDPQVLATATESFGLAALADGRVDEAGDLLRKNLRSARDIGDPRRIALARLHLAKACAAEEASTLLTQSRSWFAGADPAEPVNVAKCDLLLGPVLATMGRRADAVAHLSRALAAMRELRRPFDEARVLACLGDVATDDAIGRHPARVGTDDAAHDSGQVTGDVAAYGTALDAYQRALVIAETYGYQPLVGELREKIAALSTALDLEDDLRAL